MKKSAGKAFLIGGNILNALKIFEKIICFLSLKFAAGSL